jgi:hypothetical protein
MDESQPLGIITILAIDFENNFDNGENQIVTMAKSASMVKTLRHFPISPFPPHLPSTP